MKMHEGMERNLQAFLTVVLDRGEGSVSSSSYFTTRKRAPVPTG
jgi:hypothetical protein